MSDMIQKAVEILSTKFAGSGFDSVAKFDHHGAFALDVNGESVSAGDEAADVTLSAAPDVFEQIMTGDLDPTSAFMGGKLKIDGDMGIAMKMASMLA
ncbi:MAG: SCP2 sterol-binding domain-containing protein [Pseudomonadota bacterium]